MAAPRKKPPAHRVPQAKPKAKAPPHRIPSAKPKKKAPPKHVPPKPKPKHISTGGRTAPAPPSFAPIPAPKYFVTFQSTGITPVVVLLGTTPITISGGYGGWTVTSRERRVGLTTWAGRDPLRMQVPILFDGFANKISQELAISRLSRMAVGTATQEEPPLVTVGGPGVPKPTGPTQWVIESLTWGTNVIWDFSYLGVMSRLRQDCTVNLLQYVAGDRVAFKNLKVGTGIQAAPKSTKVAPKGWQQTVTARQGDTLKKIAARVYKPANPGDWKLISKANNIRDPNHIKKGTKIRIPKK